MGNLLLLAGLVLGAGQRPTLVQELLAARDCHSANSKYVPTQTIYCVFKIPGFEASVDGVGEANPGFTVYELDPKRFRSLGLGDGRCVFLNRLGPDGGVGRPEEELAAINIQSGRVYPEWKTCRANKP